MLNGRLDGTVFIGTMSLMATAGFVTYMMNDLANRPSHTFEIVKQCHIGIVERMTVSRPGKPETVDFRYVTQNRVYNIGGPECPPWSKS